MTVVAVCSAKGSPGVTTLACALGAVWPAGRQVLVAECDPSGGDLAVRFGLSARSGITSLVLARRQAAASGAGVSSHVQRLPGGLEVLVGPIGADAAAAVDHELAKVPSGVLPNETDSIVDCGRVVPSAPGQRRMLADANHLLVLARADASALAHARWVLDWLDTLRPVSMTSLVLEGEGPFSAREASTALGSQILGVVPYDTRGAAAASGLPGKTRGFERSPLVAAARQIVACILPDEPATERNARPAPARIAGRLDPGTRQSDNGQSDNGQSDTGQSHAGPSEAGRSKPDGVYERVSVLRAVDVGTLTDDLLSGEVTQFASEHDDADRNRARSPGGRIRYLDTRR